MTELNRDKASCTIDDNRGFTLVEASMATMFLATLLILVTTFFLTTLGDFRRLEVQDAVQRETSHFSQLLRSRSIASSGIATSQGNDFNWDLLEGSSTDLEALCFDKFSWLFVKDRQGSHSWKYDDSGAHNVVLEVPVSALASCAPQDNGNPTDVTKTWNKESIHGLAGVTVPSRGLAVYSDIIFGGRSRPLRVEAQVLDSGERMHVKAQFGSAVGLYTEWRTYSYGEYITTLTNNIVKDGDWYRCRSTADDFQRCWVETIEFTITTGEA